MTITVQTNINLAHSGMFTTDTGKAKHRHTNHYSNTQSFKLQAKEDLAQNSFQMVLETRSSFECVAICYHEQDLTFLCVWETHTVLQLIDNNMIKEHLGEAGDFSLPR